MNRAIWSLVVVLMGAGTARAEVRDLEKRVEAIVRPYVGGGWCASVVVGVLEGGRQHLFGFGDAGRGKPDGDTIYEIGSATKAMTGFLVADLVRRKKLNLDAPVSGLLPGLKLPAFEGRAITVADLVTHHSALPVFMPNLSPADWQNPYRDYTGHQLAEGLLSVKLERPPGAKYEYCNAGFATLGFLLSQREGKSYPELLAERLFRPLKLAGASVGAGPHPERLAKGHDADGQPQPAWDMKVFDAAGAVRAPARDVLAWLAANLDPAGDETGRSIAHAHKPLKPFEGGRIAYGWHIGKSGMIWHNGQTGGHHAFLGFDPKKKIGVMVLASTAAMVGDEVAVAVYSDLAGEPYTPRPLKTALFLGSAQAAAYAGRYRLAPTQELIVKADGGRLTLQVPPQQPVGLYLEAEDRFFFRVVEAGVTFHRGAGGRVERLTLHQNGDHPAPRIE